MKHKLPTLMSMLLICPLAFAEGEGDRCDAILQQDLFNRVTNSSSASASERAAFEENLFRQGESSAFEEYKKAFESKKSQNTSVDAEFHYGVIGGELNFSHAYNNAIERDEFGKKYKDAKDRYDKKVKSSSSRDNSLISLYQSSVRDEASVKAWVTCMTSSRAGPGLIAYGYRDPRGSPYIVVIWAPGSFAASTPVIDVKFGVTDVGMTIEGAPDKVQIATGSGAAYPIRFSDPGDRRAQADGFAVLVNGELKSGGNLIQSFHAEASVPRNLGPTPCAMVFGAHRNYQIGMFDPATGEARIAGQFSTTTRLPSDQREVEVYQLDMGEEEEDEDSAPSFLRLNADQLSFIERMPSELNSGGLRDIIRVTGTCSGEGVRARFANMPEVEDMPELATIPLFIRSM